jgi:integrase/recombinase XerC
MQRTPPPPSSSNPSNNTPPAFAAALTRFLLVLEGRNRSGATLGAYRSDLTQFFAWLAQTNVAATAPERVERADVTDYLAHLSRRGISGLSRARKLAALREFFRYLEGEGVVAKSPTSGVETPKKERNARPYLVRDEYTRLLSLAGANPRDYCILTLFLQTGVRVSELCALRLEDVDLAARSVSVRGKGMVDRRIELERKGLQALRSWLAVRGQAGEVDHDFLFSNRDGGPLGVRGVKKLILKYRIQAGIAKKVGAHALRHTFATAKAEQGVSPFQLKEWLGHASLNTTQIYVHLSRKNAKKVMEATSL